MNNKRTFAISVFKSVAITGLFLVAFIRGSAVHRKNKKNNISVTYWNLNEFENGNDEQVGKK